MLVYHDLLGMMQHPHHAKVTPKFCKQYAAVGEVLYPHCSQQDCDLSFWAAVQGHHDSSAIPEWNSRLYARVSDCGIKLLELIDNP